MIPFLSLKEQTAKLKPEVMAALEKVVDTQGFANGPAVEAFEKQLATYLGVGDVVAVNSGTTSLHAALIAAGVKAGDDVLTVAHTWISTAWAVSYAGATPVFCDIDPTTQGMDPAELSKRITPKTKAIIPVHLYGQPVDLDPILAFGREKGLPVIEDTAQSVGATYKGKQTGSMGLVNATSFYPGKNLGAWGEGGAVITNDSEIAARVRRPPGSRAAGSPQSRRARIQLAARRLPRCRPLDQAQTSRRVERAASSHCYPLSRCVRRASRAADDEEDSRGGVDLAHFSRLPR